MPLLAIATAFVSLSGASAAPDDLACKPQPLPPAIDSAGALPMASDAIEFAAKASFDRHAWVIRLSRRGYVDATLEIILLRRQSHCNRYDIEKRWRSPLRQDVYRSIAASVVPLGLPSADTFVPPESPKNPEIILDGTGIDLRLRAHRWEVTRRENHHGTNGAAISAIFRDLVVKQIPASELPSEDWRTVVTP